MFPDPVDSGLIRVTTSLESLRRATETGVTPIEWCRAFEMAGWSADSTIRDVKQDWDMFTDETHIGVTVGAPGVDSYTCRVSISGHGLVDASGVIVFGLPPISAIGMELGKDVTGRSTFRPAAARPRARIEAEAEPAVVALGEEPPRGKLLAGRHFIITGVLSRKHDEVSADLVSMGAGVHQSVPAAVRAAVSKLWVNVVAGDRPGSKLKEARTAGLKIITEDGLQAEIDKAMAGRGLRTLEGLALHERVGLKEHAEAICRAIVQEAVATRGWTEGHVEGRIVDSTASLVRIMIEERSVQAYCIAQIPPGVVASSATIHVEIPRFPDKVESCEA